MASIGTLHGILTLKSDQYQRGMQRAQRLTESFRAASLKMGAQILSVTAVWNLFNRAIQHGSALSDMAEQTRTSVEGLQVLGAAARDAGAKQEQLRQALIKLNANAQQAAEGNAALTAEFRALNIDVSKFIALPTERKMEALGTAYVRAADRSRAFLAVSKILGEDAGPRMLEVLRRLGTEGLDPLARSLQKTNLFLSRVNVESLDRVADFFGRMANVVVVVTAKLIPHIEQIIEVWSRFVPQGIAVRKMLESFDQVQGPLALPTTDPAAQAAAAQAAKLQAQLDLATKTTTALEELRAVEDSLVPNLELEQEINRLVDLRIRLEQSGKLTPAAAQAIQTRIGQINDEIAEAGKKSNEVAEGIALTFTSAFEDAIVEGRKLGDVLDGLIKDLIRLFVRQSITKPMFDFFTGVFSGGGIGGVFSGAGGAGVGSTATPGFGGARAAGGPVAGGRSYLVGERGRELFTAPASGMIVPNHKLAAVGGGGGDLIQVTNHFASGVTRQEVAALIPRIVEASVAAGVDARRRRKPGHR